MQQHSGNDLGRRQCAHKHPSRITRTASWLYPHGRKRQLWNQLLYVKQRSSGRDLTLPWLSLAGPDKTSSSLSGFQGSPTERRPPFKDVPRLVASISYWPRPIHLLSEERQPRRLAAMVIMKREGASCW
jgi:hypothetical protein